MPGFVATVGSMHTCPMCNPGTPPPPHIGGPITGPGDPTVLFNNKFASVMGDVCTCAGPSDMVVQGDATVLVNGVPVVTVGYLTAHGGVVTQGEPNIIISTSSPSPTVTMPKKKISFPDITFTLRAMASLTGRGGQLNEAMENQEEVRRPSR